MTVIERAIESAKNRKYKLEKDLSHGISDGHREKAKRQVEVMQVTIEALEKQIPKKPIVQEIGENTLYICPCCGKHLKRYSFGTQFGHMTNFCSKCGQAIVRGERRCISHQ